MDPYFCLVFFFKQFEIIIDISFNSQIVDPVRLFSVRSGNSTLHRYVIFLNSPKIFFPYLPDVCFQSVISGH